MYQRLPELVNAMRARLAWAGLRPEHETVILANTSSFKPLVDASHMAATSLGTRPLLLMIPYSFPFADIPPTAERAICAADFFLDLQHISWTYTASNARVVEALKQKGAIAITSPGLEEEVDTVIAHVPSEAKARRAKQAQEILDGTRVIRVTTQYGTDLRFERGDPKVLISGTLFTHGMVGFATPRGSAEGIMQFLGAIRIQSPVPERFAVRSPVRIELAEGRIKSIDRSTGKGDYLDDWFRSFGRDDALDMVEAGLPLIPLSLRHIDNEAIHYTYGGFFTGFGIMGTPLMGTRLTGQDTPNHTDWHLSRATFYADDLCLLSDGRFTPESGLAFTPEEIQALDPELRHLVS
jgi:hypothetical protein